MLGLIHMYGFVKGIKREKTEIQIAETTYYKEAFLKMIKFYSTEFICGSEEKLINETEKSELEEYVNDEVYLKEDSPEYKEILEVVIRSRGEKR